MGILDSLENGFSSFFNPQNGYKAAGNQLRKYYRDAQGNLQPYNQNGLNMFQQLLQQSQALNDPVTLENKWASSYNMSPYATELQSHATQSGLDAASSMGLMGSSAALGNIQNSSGEIMQSDRQNYMNDLMNKYMQSIGIGENIYGTGANAAGMMSNNAMNMGQNMAGMAYGQQNAPGDMFGKLLGMGVNGAINYATGGMSGMGGAAGDYSMGANAARAAGY